MLTFLFYLDLFVLTLLCVGPREPKKDIPSCKTMSKKNSWRESSYYFYSVIKNPVIEYILYSITAFLGFFLIMQTILFLESKV